MPQLQQVSLDAHSPDLAYCIGQCAHQGSRSKMEDRVLVVDLTHDPHFNHAARAVLMAVFDGHAGSEAADHLSQTLLPRLLASPCLACRDYSGALREALLEAERTLLAEYCTSGTTALVVLMVDRMLHIANVGDCRAVVCDDAEARALTWDHKPTHNKLEKARLEASGAKVSADGYVELDGNGERVEGLALSRALGGAPIKLALGCGSGGSSAAGGNGSALPSPAMSPAACTRSNSSAGAVLAGYGSTGGGAGGALAGYGSTGGGAGVPLAENGSAGANLAASGLSGYGSTGGSLSQQPSQTQLHAHQSAEPSLSSPQRPASPSPFIQYPTSRLLEQRSSGGAGAGTGAAGHGPGTTLTPLPSLQHPPGGSNPMPLLSEMGSGLICSHPSASLVVSRQNSGVTSEASVVIAEPELFQYSIHQVRIFILSSDLPLVPCASPRTAYSIFAQPASPRPTCLSLPLPFICAHPLPLPPAFHLQGSEFGSDLPYPAFRTLHFPSYDRQLPIASTLTSFPLAALPHCRAASSSLSAATCLTPPCPPCTSCLQGRQFARQAAPHCTTFTCFPSTPCCLSAGQRVPHPRQRRPVGQGTQR